MEREPSKFEEVAKQAKAKRAQLDKTTATREAKRVKDDKDEQAVRSARFPRKVKPEEKDAGTISDPNAPSSVVQNPPRVN